MSTTAGSSVKRWRSGPVPAIGGGRACWSLTWLPAARLDAFLADDGGDDRRALLADWRRRLVDRGLAPSIVNLALAASSSLLDSHGLSPPRLARVEVDPPPPRALSGAEAPRGRTRG